MPNSSHSVVYGPEYEQLLNVAYKESFLAPFRLPFSTVLEAKKMMRKVYAYFAALRGENSRPELITMCNQISMRTDGELLIFYRRADAWDNIALRKALNLKKGFADLGIVQTPVPNVAGLSSIIVQNRLKEIREREAAQKRHDKLLEAFPRK